MLGKEDEYIKKTNKKRDFLSLSRDIIERLYITTQSHESPVQEHFLGNRVDVIIAAVSSAVSLRNLPETGQEAGLQQSKPHLIPETLETGSPLLKPGERIDFMRR